MTDETLCRQCAEAGATADSACLECAVARRQERRRATKRAWAAAHPDRVKASKQAWRLNNPDAANAAIRAWQESHADQIKEKRKIRHALKSAEINAKAAEWSKTNSDKRLATEQRRRAKKAGAFVENVELSVLLERDGGICGICTLPIVTPPDDDRYKASLDHIIPLSKGGEHSYANTQPAHLICNLRKGAKLPEAA